MKEKIKKILIQSLPVILFSTLIMALVIYAWQEPTQSPPQGNVPAPINVGDITQFKSGALGVGGVIYGYSDAYFIGNVGIGTTGPTAKLHTVGNVQIDRISDASTGRLFINGGGLGYSSLNISPTGDRAQIFLGNNVDANGNKFIRVANGNLEVVNHAYSAVLFAITDAGSVGIGTSAPWVRFVVNSPLASTTNPDTGAIMSLSNSALPLGNGDPRFLDFGSLDVSTAFIRSVGRNLAIITNGLGIGTASPRGKLDLTGTGDIWVKTVRFVSNNVGWGEDNSDPYLLEKVHDSPNVSHLDLQLNDDADEEFRIYGYSCNGYGCGVRSGNLYHFFRSDGTTYHAGNVGIGTTGPQEKLDVQGGGVKVGNFKMRPISDTEFGLYDSGGNLILIFDQGI